MSSFKQPLLLKGSDESVERLTAVLKAVKDRAGLSTAAALQRAVEEWEERGGPGAECGAAVRSVSQPELR